MPPLSSSAVRRRFRGLQARRRDASRLVPGPAETGRDAWEPRRSRRGGFPGAGGLRL